MIFLSYVSQDRDRVNPYYELLESKGFDVWIDHKRILPGQNWNYEIRTALDRADQIIIFISENSVDKRGYAQREISIALEKLEEKLLSDIYIIPILLDDVDPPNILKKLHYLKSNGRNVSAELLRSIETASSKAKSIIEHTQKESDLKWGVTDAKSSYSGIPGYSTSIQRISLSSPRYKDVSNIADHINGKLAEMAMATRQNSLNPDPILYNLMQDEWRRTDNFDAIFSSAKVRGRVLSVVYFLNWYMAGAAHPTHSPLTFNYLLEPAFFIEKPQQLFQSNDALLAIQRPVRLSLTQNLTSGNYDYADINWINEGTSSWDSFSNFSFDESGITFQFGSYQVACYAAGTPTAHVPYSALTEHLTDTFLHALNLYRTG